MEKVYRDWFELESNGEEGYEEGKGNFIKYAPSPPKLRNKKKKKKLRLKFV